MSNKTDKETVSYKSMKFLNKDKLSDETFGYALEKRALLDAAALITGLDAADDFMEQSGIDVYENSETVVPPTNDAAKYIDSDTSILLDNFDDDSKGKFGTVLLGMMLDDNNS